MQKLKEIDFVREGRQIVKDYLLIVLGTLIAGWSFGSFFLPHDIAPGGVTGISTVLARFLPLSVGMMSFVINLPLFLLGWRTVGWRFAVRSFAAMSLLSLFIDILPLHDLTGDVMLATIYGGARRRDHGRHGHGGKDDPQYHRLCVDSVDSLCH